LGCYYDTPLLQKDFPLKNIALDLHSAQRRRIERQLRKTSDKIEAMRCRVFLLLDAGHPVRDISERVDCVRATVYRTLYRFEELGEAGIADRRLYPEARKVTPELMNYVLSLLDLSPRSMGWQRSTWTLELLARQVEEKMKVRLCASHV
jgi:transposase